MKKTLLALLLVALLFLASCGGKTTPPTTDAPDTDTTSADAGEPTDQATDAPTEAPTEADEPLVTIDGLNIKIKDDGNGENGTGNGLKKESIVYSENIGFTTDVGPLKFSIGQTQLVNVTCTSNDTASYFDTAKGEPFAMLVFDVKIENTSDEDISWYPNQSVIVTNTKDQVSCDLLLCDDVGGDFLGQVIKTGQIYFVISSTTADQIDHVQWRIDSPHDSNYDHVGDDLKLEIDLVR